MTRRAEGDPVRTALEQFVDTIDAVGGVMFSPLVDGYVPAVDEEWQDLGEAYVAACKALGREPKEVSTWSDEEGYVPPEPRLTVHKGDGLNADVLGLVKSEHFDDEVSLCERVSRQFGLELTLSEATSYLDAVRKRCLVRVQPQAWVNDNAMDIDPQGGIEIDVTDRIVEMGKEKALSITDCSAKSDVLVEGLHEYQGPFSVYCKEAIEKFFKEDE